MHAKRIEKIDKSNNNIDEFSKMFEVQEDGSMLTQLSEEDEVEDETPSLRQLLSDSKQMNMKCEEKLACPLTDECDKTFRVKRQLILHLASKNHLESELLRRQRSFPCCSKIKNKKQNMPAHIAIAHNGLEPILRRMDPKILRKLEETLASAKEQPEQIDPDAKGSWNRSCPFQDCNASGVRTQLKKLLEHFVKFHFEKEIEEAFEKDLERRECTTCGHEFANNNSPTQTMLIKHIVMKHDGLKKALGEHQYEALLQNSVIAKDQ